MVIPALLAWWLFAALRRISWLTHPGARAALVAASALALTLTLVYSVARLAAGSQGAVAITLHPLTLAGALLLAGLAAWAERWLENAPEFPLGLVVGELSVLATASLNALVLAWGGHDDWHTLAVLVFAAHLPVAAVEGVVLGFTVGFLARVKPEMLGWSRPPAPLPTAPSTGNGVAAPHTEMQPCPADPLS
jgi:ABC-type Co2+ transport system permease subunit